MRYRNGREVRVGDFVRHGHATGKVVHVNERYAHPIHVAFVLPGTPVAQVVGTSSWFEVRATLLYLDPEQLVAIDYNTGDDLQPETKLVQTEGWKSDGQIGGAQ